MTCMQESTRTAPPAASELEHELEQHRRELVAYCYRMLASPFEAEDAVQETFLRAWRAYDRFEGRAALRSWLYRLAFVAALQHLPPRQRAVLILCEVLRWQATEVAELLETTVASVNSALQRARATLADGNVDVSDPSPPLGDEERALLDRYVAAFEAYDIDALTNLIQEDATQSMPPFDLWLSGRDDIFAWWFGPGIGCRDSRLLPTVTANGSPAYGQYKPAADGGYEPWALQVVEFSDGKIGELTFFLDTERLFPLFGLPARLDA